MVGCLKTKICNVNKFSNNGNCPKWEQLQDDICDDIDFYCCGKHGESWRFDKKTCIKFGSRAVS